jgi:hypothetical protein
LIASRIPNDKAELQSKAWDAKSGGQVCPPYAADAFCRRAERLAWLNQSNAVQIKIRKSKIENG